MSVTKHIARSGALILLCIVFFEATNTDVWIQSHFFDAASGRWLLDRNSTVLRLLFYDGPKALLILFLLGLAVSLLP